MEGDATTPTDHAVALFEAARGPRRLIMQRHTTHYAAYDDYWEQVTPLIVEWFERYISHGDVVVSTAGHATPPRAGAADVDIRYLEKG